MTILDDIFEQLPEEVAKGRALPTPLCPPVEEELIPHILRPMSDDELALMAARDEAIGQAERMAARLMILHQVGLLEDAAPDNIKHDELKKFKALLLGDLFFWHMEAATDFQFASLYQRTDREGKVVLIGLKTAEAQAFYRKRQEARELSEQIGREKPGPRLVN